MELVIIGKRTKNVIRRDSVMGSCNRIRDSETNLWDGIKRRGL